MTLVLLLYIRVLVITKGRQSKKKKVTEFMFNVEQQVVQYPFIQAMVPGTACSLVILYMLQNKTVV